MISKTEITNNISEMISFFKSFALKKIYTL